ncbi:MAG: hypothetical protein GC165_08100 [Armatimonadetes bacterium]|nr:hypothetical protein [Armatimonadota bacterium]
MRNIVLPLGAIIMVGAVCSGFFMSVRNGSDKDSGGTLSRRMGLGTGTWPPSYPALMSDGTSLSIDGVQALTVGEQERNKTGIGLYSISRADKKDTLSFAVDGNTVTHTAYSIHEVTWCQAKTAYFFVQSEKDSDGGEKAAIWQWNREKGFQQISKPHGPLTDLTVSLDGAVVMARAEGESYMGMAMSEDFLLVSTRSRHEKVVTYPDQSTGATPLSMDEVLIDGHNKYGNQTYRWNLGDDVKPLVHDASIVSVATAAGRLFGIHKKAKGFEIVEMNDKMDGWTNVYSLPKSLEPKAN